MSNQISEYKSFILIEKFQNYIDENEEKKKQTIKNVKAILEIKVMNVEGREQIWTLDLKNEGTIKTGKGSTKPDITIRQKAIMAGKLDIKGYNISKLYKILNVTSGAKLYFKKRVAPLYKFTKEQDEIIDRLLLKDEIHVPPSGPNDVLTSLLKTE
ncbi:11761_t:CDS:2 [Entrophospora sp. SA101]|nr:3315_t:CDS:2 [Entrophospora sp. SA101]CAJ0768886.1 11761_t:CDS:2 [Entrophospora sp. SA101]